MDEADRRSEINEGNEWARFVEKNKLTQNVPAFVPQGPISLAQVKAIRRADARRAANT